MSRRTPNLEAIATISSGKSLQRNIRRRTEARHLTWRRLRIETLEDRRLLAVVTVGTLDDTVDIYDGVTSLREAIFATNLVGGADTIEFAPSLTAAGPATIVHDVAPVVTKLNLLWSAWSLPATPTAR